MSSSEEYFCNCPEYCKQRKKVSRRTYFNHAPYRQPALQSLEEFAAVVGAPHYFPPRVSVPLLCQPVAGPSRNSGAPAHKKRRIGQEDDVHARQGAVSPSMVS